MVQLGSRGEELSGQILHGSARTTEAVRRAIQHSQESIRALAGHYGINPKTVAKWKRRTTAADAAMGPKAPSSTVLTVEEEAIIVAFRKHTLLPLDTVRATAATLAARCLHLARLVRRARTAKALADHPDTSDVSRRRPHKKRRRQHPTRC